MKKAFGEVREVLGEVHRLLTGNRIFMDRMVGVGALSREETIAYAITGPLLRAVGVAYDVRRAQPHWAYDRVDFEIPTQRDGDNYARYLVRMAEMEQSMRIAEQALAALPGGRHQRGLRGPRDRSRRRTSIAASRARPTGSS